MGQHRQEGASTIQGVTVEGPLPGADLGAQNPFQACYLQERNLVRQKYIVSEGRGEVVIPSPAAVVEGPPNHPPVERQLKTESQATREEMSRFYWYEVLSRSYWHKKL